MEHFLQMQITGYLVGVTACTSMPINGIPYMYMRCAHAKLLVLPIIKNFAIIIIDATVCSLQSDPLQKAMTAFASALGVSITKLKFLFDGDPIKPTQTADDLDMENDDCIDVAMVA